MNISIYPPDGFLEASVDLPLSKSMCARALIINAVGGFEAPSTVSDCDDTRALVDGLSSAQASGLINVGPAGTAMRFLTAYFASLPGSDITIDGNERMRKRPIAVLVDALRQLGAQIEYAGEEGFPPLRIKGQKLQGGNVSLDPSVSSQFVSALMMIAPRMAAPLCLNFDGEPVSLSYIKMTTRMMADAGVDAALMFNRLEVPNTPYVSPVGRIERDWSAASYWYSIVALSAGCVTLNDMSEDSAQGDSRMVEFGARLGAETVESEDTPDALEVMASPEQHSRLDADMSENPDLVQTLAVAAAALGIPFRFTGVHTLRDKETDRLEALKTEALKLGLIFETEGDDILCWEGKRVPIQSLPIIDTYGDHRMAMAFAPLSIFVPGIVINDCEVVSKSYPAFWTHLEEAGFELREYDPEEATQELPLN